MEEQAAPYLANGQLVRVLEDWCEPFAGYFLYYPSRRQQPAALTALIDTLRPVVTASKTRPSSSA
jgi:DNA-binding transcriptional LysR family regulator